MADRYAYVPLIGLLLMLCWGVGHRVTEQRTLKGTACVAAGAVLVVGAALSRVQVGCWKDDETLFRHAVNVTRDNWLAHNNLGVILNRAGKPRDAIAQYEQALRIKPDYADAHDNLGLALCQVGRIQEAIGHYEQALRFEPDYARAHCNLGVALEQTGRIRKAMGHYEQALRAEPDFAAAQNNLAWLLATLAPADGGDPARAVPLALRASELAGNRAAYLDTLAAAYAAAGRFNDAVATAQKAVEFAGSAGQPEVVQEINARLELYRGGRAYRQPVHAKSSRNP